MMSETNDHVVTLPAATANSKGLEPDQVPRSQAKRWHQEFRDSLNNIGQRYYDCPAEKENQLIDDLKDVWEDMIRQVEAWPTDSAEQDRIITTLSSFVAVGRIDRKQGACSECKKDEPSKHHEGGWMCDVCGYPLEDDEGLAKLAGHCWTDLPHLGDTLLNHWINESNKLTANERERLAIFTAKLLSVGICTVDTAKCALWFLKEVLEIDRTPVEIPFMVEMLPACVRFFEHAHAKLLLLCDGGPYYKPVNYRHFKGKERQTGPLYVFEDSGFSMDRWLVWRERFGELYRSKDERVSRLAREGFEVMVSTGRSLGLPVWGEQNFLKNAFEKLDEIVLAARASGGEACASLKQIEIDPDWVQRKRKAMDSD